MGYAFLLNKRNKTRIMEPYRIKIKVIRKMKKIKMWFKKINKIRQFKMLAHNM